MASLSNAPPRSFTRSFFELSMLSASPQVPWGTLEPAYAGIRRRFSLCIPASALSTPCKHLRRLNRGGAVATLLLHWGRCSSIPFLSCPFFFSPVSSTTLFASSPKGLQGNATSGTQTRTAVVCALLLQGSSLQASCG